MKYINYNSTFPNVLNGGVNFSDKAYNENIKRNSEYLNLIGFIKSEFNLDENAKVILTSGSTESCATCFHWIQHYSKFGVVYGSALDHESIKINAKNYNLRYKTLNIFTENETFEIPEDASAVIITLTSGMTGEIYPYEKLNTKFNYIDDYGNGFYDARQYRPLIIGDLTQSIGKNLDDYIDYNMFDAFYFSLHKLGCSGNTGILVINSDVEFIPLISGLQQNGLRGGTLDISLYIPFIKQYQIYKEMYNLERLKSNWINICEKIDKLGLERYKPRLKHNYTTILINTYHCNLKLINDLENKYGIYVGTSSACALESNETVPTIRLSFLTGDELT
jgi:cysteine sulfinate desulfinase/cysteine desulfurase-like protein